MKRLALTALVSSALLLSACGSRGTDDEPDGGSGATAAAGTDLVIVVRVDEAGTERRFTLRCDPAGGDHPDPEAACAALDELKSPFTPVAPDAMCTEIYGGPQTATVTGTFRGEKVEAEFSRNNGCEIARWDAHLAVLVEAGGAEGG